MYYRIVKDDVLKSKGVTAATLLFIVAAAALVASGASLAAHLLGAVDALMESARTPHFMQMHAGPLDTAGLRRFAAEEPLVEDFFVGEFLNVNGASFSLGGESLASSVQDNGLWTQADGFDLLLGLDGEPIRPSDGELYVPLAYLRDGSAALGGVASVAGRRFAIAGFIRDSQMNSPLASSKRFLVSKADFEALRAAGTVEYLISFRLEDPASVGAFEAAYAEAGLPANGPTLTYPLFRMINAVSDGFTAALLALSGAMAVGVALLCVRFTLLAKIEDDYREIGVMKAIGLRVADIKRLYLAKYACMAIAGSLLGWALASMLSGPLLARLRQAMGEGSGARLGPAFSALGAATVGASVIAYVYAALDRFRKVSAADALRFGAPADAAGGKGHRRPRLSRSRLLGTNALVALKDVLASKRLYAVMALVLAAATFMAVVPSRIHATVASPGFSAYMGVGECDLRLDLQQVDDIPGKARALAEALRADPSVAASAVLVAKALWVKDLSGARVRLKTELGDHTAFPVSYASGGPPVGAGEIALSAINARELGKAVGDALSVDDGSGFRELRVRGIYGDLTNGGKTAKAGFDAPGAEPMWAVAYARLADPSGASGAAARFAAAFPYAKASDIAEFVRQTFSSTIQAVRAAAIASSAVALSVAALVAYLFMRMIAAKDSRSDAVLRAIGFTGADIRAQYAFRAGMALAVGILLGAIAADSLGEALTGVAIGAFGAASFRFLGLSLAARLALPLGLAAAAFAAAVVGSRRACGGPFVDRLKE